MDILKDKIRPMYGKYLVAASGSAMISCVFGMIDAMMVGQYHGPTGNAAMAVCSPLWSIFYSLGLLVGIGGSVLFGNHRGRGEDRTAQEYFTLSVLFGIVLTILAMAGIGLFHERLLRFFGEDDELIVLAKQYFIPLFFAMPCCVFSYILSSYIRNDGNPALPTKAVLYGGILNVFGDYVFVFMLDLGILGAGIATAIGLYVSSFLMLLHFWGKKNTLRLVWPTQISRKIVFISVTGFSTAINDLAMGIIGILFNRQIMKYFGSNALAVYGIITQVTIFAQCMAYGIGQATQPILSQNLGAGKYGRIRECLRYGLFTCGCYGAVLTAGVVLMPNAFVHFFMRPTEAVLEIAPAILRSYGLSYILLPFNLFATYYLQSMMKPNPSMIVSLARGAIVSGVMIIVLPVMAGADALWYSMLITELLVAAYAAVHMIKCTKKLAK